MSDAERDAGLVAAADALIRKTYVVSADVRQADMGLSYVTAEMSDLARFVARLLKAERQRGETDMRERAGWRTMGSAPKDGTRVLLKVRVRQYLGDETEAVAVGYWLDNSATKPPWQGWATDMGPTPRAYGWMPLPPPSDSSPFTEM